MAKMLKLGRKFSMTRPSVKSIYRNVLQHKFLLLFFILITTIFLLNSLHILFPDEYDNMLGGLLITRGKLPYIDYFAHHGPGAYFVAAAITIFSGAKVVYFRIIYNFLISVLLFCNFYLLSKKIKFNHTFYYLFLILVSLLSIYFWGHIMLADSVVAWLLIVPYSLIFLKMYLRKKMNLGDIWLISISTFFILLTSLTYVFAIFFLVLFSLIYYLQTNRNLNLHTLVKLFVIYITPYLVFVFYLIVTGSMAEYIFQNFTYNIQYYAFDINGVPATRPLSYALAIYELFADKFIAALRLSKDLNFKYPLVPTLVVGNSVLFVNLLIKKRFHLLLLILLVLGFVCVRSNPLDTSETDFHGAPYVVLALFNTCFVLTLIWESLKLKGLKLSKILNVVFFVYLGTYMIFFTIFCWKFFSNKVYLAATKKITLINNHSAVADYINLLTSKDDYVWVGPFAFEEWVYLQSNSPSKYYWILGAHAKSEKIRGEIVQDFEVHKPKVIVFNNLYSQFNQFPKDFHWLLLDWMEDKYFRLSDLNSEQKQYEPTIKIFRSITLDYEFERDFYFDKSRKDEIVTELINNNLIKKAN